jgi:tetratricopeptide (TPR) repeat protein
LKIKYNKKKEELRKDPVLESIGKIRGFVVKNSNIVISGVLVLIFIFAGFQIYSYFKKTGMLKSQEAFGKAASLYKLQQYDKAVDAFKLVIENHGKSSHALYSCYMIGQILLGSDEYDKAIPYFEKALSFKKNTSFLRGESLVGIGTSYEAKGDLEKSLQYFKEALNDEKIRYRHHAIQWKMALINKKLGKKENVLYYCNKLVSDTLISDYKKKAENLLAAM